MNKFYKKLLFMLLLLISPMVMLGIFGAIFIAVNLLGGLEFQTAFSSFKAALHALMPYFPYLTIIPAALVILAYLIKNRTKT